MTWCLSGKLGIKFKDPHLVRIRLKCLGAFRIRKPNFSCNVFLFLVCCNSLITHQKNQLKVSKDAKTPLAIKL